MPGSRRLRRFPRFSPGVGDSELAPVASLLALRHAESLFPRPPASLGVFQADGEASSSAGVTVRAIAVALVSTRLDRSQARSYKPDFQHRGPGPDGIAAPRLSELAEVLLGSGSSGVENSIKVTESRLASGTTEKARGSKQRREPGAARRRCSRSHFGYFWGHACHDACHDACHGKRTSQSPAKQPCERVLK